MAEINKLEENSEISEIAEAREENTDIETKYVVSEQSCKSKVLVV